ncbi:MAG: DNA polymerase III subunit beta [Bacteroidales bacterium]|nr:DNA polymerase III subunit beta [Bacteroidales bacterium]MBQ7213993.1 DNA polymerase III subunit beta [Bacteroidales bacterium]
MKFVVSNSDLLVHMQAISKVIVSKPQNPIQSHILLTLQGNRLTMRATGPDTSASAVLELSSASQEGSVAVPAKFILDMLSTFSGSEQPLTFDVDEESRNITVYSENGQYTFAGQDGQIFPTDPELREDLLVSFEMDAGIFISAFASTLFATGEDEYRPVMSGILMEFDGQTITFVSSDAHKLVRYRYHLPENESVPGSGSFIIHKRPAGLLKNMLTRTSSKVQVSFDDKNAMFRFDEYTLICRLIAGRFPNYNSVIPQYNPNVVTVNRQAFLTSLSRAQVFAAQSTLLVTLSLSGNQITLGSQDTDMATRSKENLKCQYEGQDMEIGFKSEYLIGILSSLTSTEVQMQLSDPSRPGLIVPVGTAEDQAEDVLMLLMPMKV